MDMNLQYFAEDTGNTEATSQDPQTNSKEVAEEQSKPEAKTFTQAEVNEMIRKRLARNDKKHEEDVQAARDEATRLAKMNNDQKKDYELQQAKKEAQENAAKLARYEMRDQARKMLDEHDLSLSNDELALVVTDKADSTKEKVEQLANFADRLREQMRKELLKGNTPRVNGTQPKPKKTFGQMTVEERIALQQSNPDLYKQLKEEI